MAEQRLIDANALDTELKADNERLREMWAKAVSDLSKCKAERQKGRWVWNEESECWVCSNCELSALNNYRGNSTDSNYCPNCGADMRGESDGCYGKVGGDTNKCWNGKI